MIAARTVCQGLRDGLSVKRIPRASNRWSRGGEGAEERTLTNLYNARSRWLANAHAALDEAVAEAYGWSEDWRGGMLTDDEILARLFALSQRPAGLA